MNGPDLVNLADIGLVAIAFMIMAGLAGLVYLGRWVRSRLR